MANAPEPSRRSHLRVAFAIIVAVLVAGGVLKWLDAATRARIEHNERAWFDAQLQALIPATLHDNDLLSDRVELSMPNAMGPASTVTVYRARQANRPTAAALHVFTEEGYGGVIELLIAVDYDGAVLGVRVLSHHETPGIGNAFEFPGSTWLQSFAGRSLHNTRAWALRKDGGEFDAFTSASITPRVVVKAVQATLEFYQRNRERIYG